MKKGFTLAEVLITLAIIGVVAALTIPSVVANYQQQEFKTGLKKAVNVLNDAITMNIANEGETPYENEDLFTYLQRHMSVIKSVGGFRNYDSKDNSSKTTIQNSAFYTTDGMRFETLAGGGNYLAYKLKLHESGRMNLYKPLSNGSNTEASHFCGSYGLGKNPNKTKYSPCIVVVDVNGDRKPSIYSSNETTEGFLYKKSSIEDGRLTDIFVILITEDKAIPFGVVAQRAMYGK